MPTKNAPAADVLTADRCPQCAADLTRYEGQPPWCGRCEWNLEAYVPLRNATWFVRSIDRLDHRAGFRADSLLISAKTADEIASPKTGAGQIVLRVISGLLLLIFLTTLATGVWLIVTGTALAVVLGLALVALAYAFRPRLGRLRTLVQYTFQLAPEKTPGIYALVNRVAEATGAPRPHVVLASLDFNAATVTVGLRRRRVLMLGIPLMVSLTPQELVSVIAHELGHLRYRDSLRSLLTQPARTQFGVLARAVRAPRMPSAGVGPYGFLLLFWMIVGGALSFFLSIIHLGLNIIDARERRRAELRADLMAVRAAGRDATLSSFDGLVMIPVYASMIDGGRAAQGAVKMWRQRVEHVRQSRQASVATLRQLSKRTGASLFASHPSTGRRHEFLSRTPNQAAAVVVSESESQRIDTELGPYAEVIRKKLAEAYEM